MLPYLACMNCVPMMNYPAQRIYEENGIDMSLQSVMICGAAQGLENRVPLRDCCVANSIAGNCVAAKGQDELHLELRVQEPVFPGDCAQVSGSTLPSEQSIALPIQKHTTSATVSYQTCFDERC